MEGKGRFQALNSQYDKEHQSVDVMYDFVQEYNKDLATAKDYGTGERLYTLEAHILRFIRYNPGTTVTRIAEYWKKTKATVSPQIAKLEREGYVKKVRSEEDSKVQHLYLTEKGMAFDDAHQAYDDREMDFFLEELRKEYTDEEIQTFYAILGDFKLLLSRRNRKSAL